MYITFSAHELKWSSRIELPPHALYCSSARKFPWLLSRSLATSLLSSWWLRRSIHCHPHIRIALAMEASLRWFSLTCFALEELMCWFTSFAFSDVVWRNSSANSTARAWYWLVLKWECSFPVLPGVFFQLVKWAATRMPNLIIVEFMEFWKKHTVLTVCPTVLCGSWTYLASFSASYSLLSNFNCWNTLNIFKNSLSWIFIKLHAPYRVNLPLFLLPGLSKNQGSEHVANAVNSKRKYKVFLIKPQRLLEIQVAEAEEWRGVMKDHVETLIWFYRLQIGNFTTPKLNVWIFTHSLVTGWLIVFFQTLQIY